MSEITIGDYFASLNGDKDLNVYDLSLLEELRDYLEDMHLQGRQSGIDEKDLQEVITPVAKEALKKTQEMAKELFKRTGYLEEEVHLSPYLDLSSDFLDLMSPDEQETHSNKIQELFYQSKFDNSIVRALKLQEHGGSSDDMDRNEDFQVARTLVDLTTDFQVSQGIVNALSQDKIDARNEYYGQQRSVDLHLMDDILRYERIEEFKKQYLSLYKDTEMIAESILLRFIIGDAGHVIWAKALTLGRSPNPQLEQKIEDMIRQRFPESIKPKMGYLAAQYIVHFQPNLLVRSENKDPVSVTISEYRRFSDSIL